MTRYLRIAAVGFFVLLIVALIALWVRSYFLRDQLIYVGNDSLWLTVSRQGGTAIDSQVTGTRVADDTGLISSGEIIESQSAGTMPTSTAGFGCIAAVRRFCSP
jgi:hypothetical protein